MGWADWKKYWKTGRLEDWTAGRLVRRAQNTTSWKQARQGWWPGHIAGDRVREGAKVDGA